MKYAAAWRHRLFSYLFSGSAVGCFVRLAARTLRGSVDSSDWHDCQLYSGILVFSAVDSGIFRDTAYFAKRRSLYDRRLWRSVGSNETFDLTLDGSSDRASLVLCLSDTK